MFLQNPKFVLIILTAIGCVALGVIGYAWADTITTQESFESISSTQQVSPLKLLEVKLQRRARRPEKREVKGLYLTAYSASSPEKLKSIIDLIDRTELNAVVIDIKDYTGKILYDSHLGLVNELGTDENRLGDVRAIVNTLHEHDIYVIGRQTVFQDPILAEKKSAWAIQDTAGGVWRDQKGLSWVDPTQEAVWRYNVAIAKEAIRFGFDEINFDYVRFPTDGDMRRVVYTTGNRERVAVMRDFYHFLSTELAFEPAWISLDFFGFVMERHDGMSIGQRLEDAVDETDYISPMMYPSHYPNGHLGFDNPAEHPGAVIENGMQKGLPWFASSTRAQVRPWIQAFNIGAVYDDGPKIREQIDMVEKYTDAGWLLWNASNRYSSAGLKSL